MQIESVSTVHLVSLRLPLYYPAIDDSVNRIEVHTTPHIPSHLKYFLILSRCFSTVPTCCVTEWNGTNKQCRRFESKELKMIRVAVSSFYDYLTLVLKTLQEFDTTIL